MKQLRKRIVAVMCVVAMLAGIVFQNGIVLDTKAADTASASATDEYAREWWVYGDDADDTGLVVADTANGVTANSISDAGVNLPDGLIEANMELQINLTVEGTDISTLNGSGACFELSNELNDCAELSWVYQNFVSGENNISFAFKDAAHTNGTAVNGKGVQDGKSPFDWQETIDYFRCYQQGSPSDIKITVNEIKIVYTDAGLTFGADDTYLQLGSAMSATPNAVEATVNMPRSAANLVSWTLHEGTTFTGVSMSVDSYTTTVTDKPGAGMTCFVLDASSTAITGFDAFQTQEVTIDANAYEKEDLALSFWVYSSTNGTLAPDYNGGQLRVGSDSDLNANFLYYYMYEINVDAGWNYIEIPLSEFKWDACGTFSIDNINVWGIMDGHDVPQGMLLRYGDMKLVAIGEEKDESVIGTIFEGNNIQNATHTLSTGVTTVSEAPGAGMTYSILDASSSAISGFGTRNSNLGINAGSYQLDELAMAFWVYAENAGTLGTSGQIRLGNLTYLGETPFLYYDVSKISVSAGWNYIEFPLNDWYQDQATGFSCSSINCFGFDGLSLAQGDKRYFGDFEIVIVDEETEAVVTEWEIFTANTIANANQSFTTGTTSVTDEPGEGMEYIILDSVSGFGTRNSDLAINAGNYKMEELAVAFWVYSNNEGTIGTGGNFRLGNVNYLGETPFLYYMFSDISVEIGWNYIELPLNDWHQDQASGFSTASLNCFGFDSYNLASGEVRWFGDFKVVVLGADSSTVIDEGNIEVTKNIADVSENYMILSNANAADESNQFALYVTEKGYPAVLYGTTQYVYKQNICIGEDVQLKAIRNSSGAIEFYINGTLVGTSQTKVSALGAPSTAYSIGADGAGTQTFVGTIKDVKTYSDTSATTCTGNWPLVGDTNYVVETMPDISGNGNNANFKGTRANEWYDVEAIGEDDWSLVFIPDIVQRFYAGEHATWHKMASWIGDNIQSEHIKYVIGAKTADSAQASAMNNGYEFFDNAVATTNYNTADENSYYRFQVNGVKWMILSLKKGWEADATAVFTWGKEIIEKYPYDNVIITCDNYYNSIWSELGSFNVKLVVYGSQGAEPTEDVPAMNFPAQNDLEANYFGEQGLGLMYMIRFTDGGTKVTARSYAPIYDSYFTSVVNYEKTIDTVKAPKAITVKYAGATPGVAPTDGPEGYLFAGWFTASGIAEEWTLHSGQYFTGASMGTGSYTTTADDEPGEGMVCAVLDASSAAITGFDAFQTQETSINVSAYSKDELALSFWVYSNTTGTLAPDYNGGQLRIGNSSAYENCLFYYMYDIAIEQGWNYIEIPLNSFKTEIAGTFTLEAVNAFGILDGHDVPAGMILKYGDFKLVRYGADCSAESALKEATTGTVYARFVDQDLLNVKAQITAGTSDMSNYSSIRFVTSTDRLEYKRMGIDISYAKDNGETANKNIENRYVYQQLYAVGANGGDPAPYSPSDVIAASSTYFKAYTIKNVPNRAFDRDFTATAYWITLDGTKVYGETIDKSVWMGYPTNEESLPKIVTTTYATDDVVIADVVLTEEKYGYLDDVVDGDWSTALQNALNDVHNKGGGTVYVPAGEYELTKSILIPSDVTLRGDWQDPDEGTAYGTIFNIYPTQELAGANRNADSVHNADTNGDGYSDVAAFVMTGSSGVVGITAYYPEQSLSDVKEYPYTFYVTVGNDGGQLITLKNITVINGYRGIGTRYETQHEALIVENFKGTFLDCGMAIYNSADTGTVTNATISSKYWANSSLGAADASDYILANATAMELGDLEWHQLSNCTIDGYYVGISIVGGYRTNFSGSMIDMSITGCATGITIANENDSTYYAGSNIEGKDAYPLKKALDPRWGMVIARSTIEGTTNSIVNNTTPTLEYNAINWPKIGQTSALVRLTDVTVNGTIVENNYSDTSYGTSISDSEKNVRESSEDLGDSSNAQYDATYVKPTENLWVVDLTDYDGANVDVSAVINDAMNKVLERNANGGIVYIPGGTYRLDNPITVPAGVELRGASSVANREQYIDCEGTLFMVYYGDDSSSSSSGTALITLNGDNTGVSGMRFLYPENIQTYDADLNSTYTIAANGASNVHVTNCYITASSYGVNLTDCDNFYVEGVFACVYNNTINVSGSGVIRGCWSNPNAIVRTNAEGLTTNWPEEATYNNSTAVINQIRNYLKDNLTFISVSGSDSNVLVRDVIAYAVNTLVSNDGATVTAINTNADCMDETNGVPFYVKSGTLTAINSLRSAVSDTGTSVSATRYAQDGGTLTIYNSMTPKIEGAEDESAFETNKTN